MSIESAKEFYEKIQKDDTLRAKLEAASKEDRPQILKDAGYDFTKEEIKEVAENNTELSADDLEKISGGKNGDWLSAAGIVAGAVVAAI